MLRPPGADRVLEFRRSVVGYERCLHCCQGQLLDIDELTAEKVVETRSSLRRFGT